MTASKRRIGANLGFIAWQKPVTMKEMVEVMFARGMSQDETIERLQGRFNAISVAARWREAYANRPFRPAAYWSPKVIRTQSEGRP